MSAEASRRGSLVPGTTLGEFRIDRIAGTGAMGVVYQAVQLSLGRTVALKVIADHLVEDAAFRARFAREARSAARLAHPNIVSVHETGEVEGRLYLAMAWVDGGDLRERVIKSGPLPPPLASGVVGQIADALDAAHASGVLHRDVKPANILLQQTGARLHAYLTDFGVTRPFVELGSGSGALTQSGHVVGTPGFLAPEQIEGRDVDGRADLYALGCVLCEALTGRPPFERETSVATLLAHASAPRPVISEMAPSLGTGFDEIVRTALAIDPAHRYPTGRAFTAALRATLTPPALPKVKPAPRLPTLSDPGRPRASTPPAAPPRPPRLVVDLDPMPSRDTPVAAPMRQPHPGASRSRTGPPPQRPRAGALGLLVAGTILILAITAVLLSRGGEAPPTVTDEFAVSTPPPTSPPGPSQGTAAPPAAVPGAAAGQPAVREAAPGRADARTEIVSTLRTYARGWTERDLDVIGSALARRVGRTGRDPAGVCATSDGRTATLRIIQPQLASVARYSFPFLSAEALPAPRDGSATVRTQARIVDRAGVASVRRMRFSLVDAGDTWKIVQIEAPC